MATGSSSPVHARPRLERRSKVVSLAYFSSDDELVAGLRAGRTDAQAEIFRRFELRVAALLHHVIGTHHELPELVEEVFTRAFAEAKALRGSAAVLEPWLVRIAVARARSFLWRRSLRRWFGGVRGWRSDRHRISAVAGSANAAQLELLARFYAVADRLPLGLRMCLLLEVVDGMSVPEIAEASASSTSQVKRQLQRARVRFHALAAAEGLLRGRAGATCDA